MTNKDEKLIAEYMGWQEDELLVGYCIAPDRTAHFDLNDAGLCVKKMQKRGDLDDFNNYALMMCFKVAKIDIWPTNFFAWLYNADNFFEAMAKWLKEEKK
jgi:hypothetical protein